MTRETTAAPVDSGEELARAVDRALLDAAGDRERDRRREHRREDVADGSGANRLDAREGFAARADATVDEEVERSVLEAAHRSLLRAQGAHRDLPARAL